MPVSFIVSPVIARISRTEKSQAEPDKEQKNRDFNRHQKIAEKDRVLKTDVIDGEVNKADYDGKYLYRHDREDGDEILGETERDRCSDENVGKAPDPAGHEPGKGRDKFLFHPQFREQVPSSATLITEKTAMIPAMMTERIIAGPATPAAMPVTTIATALSANGRNVGLLDLDIHGLSIPKMLGIEGQGLTVLEKTMEPAHVTGNLSVISMGLLLPDTSSPVIWRGPVKMAAIQQFLNEVNWGSLDYLIVDRPPGTGDEALTIIQIAPNVKGAVIVTTPQDVAVLDAIKAVKFIEKLDLPVIGIIENMSGMVCPGCGEKIDLFGRGGGEKAAKDLGVPFLGAIPLDPTMVKAGEEGRPYVLRHIDTSSWKAMNAVMENLVKVVES
ncbi:MAG: Iron-sulfur cluster carrier protein [Methanoregula sp. SKADARSKE-2]|nr:MAG: Iron-sulfur cluster carrier protein [Methanoregula sp. SKADARSKE-2]